MSKASDRLASAARAYSEALNGSGPADVPAAAANLERAYQSASPEDREAAARARNQETGGGS